MKHSNLYWILILAVAVFAIWGISKHFQLYSEEPHLTKPQQAALSVTLLSTPVPLPSLAGNKGAKVGHWYGLLLQPAICDAICQGEAMAFEQSGQVVIRPHSSLYQVITSSVSKEGYPEHDDLLLLINPKGQFAGSISPPYDKQKIEDAFKALNQ